MCDKVPIYSRGNVEIYQFRDYELYPYRVYLLGRDIAGFVFMTEARDYANNLHKNIAMANRGKHSY